MGAQAPQWLFGAFVEAMRQIGATATEPVLAEEARTLVALWSAPNRHLHNPQYLVKVLARIDELSSGVHDPDVLRVAFWYHGAFLDEAVEVRVNASSSSALCTPCLLHTTERLTALGVSEDVIARIQELLHALITHRVVRGDSDIQVLIDADRSALASSPQVYKKYVQAMREEFSDLDDDTYWRARRRVVRKLLASDAIFHSPLTQSWEDTARSNLEAELSRLGAQLGDGDFEDTDQPDADFDQDDSARRDSDVSATGTLIIRRRPLRKNACVSDDDELTSTGVLPPVLPLEEAPKATEEDSGSSLETAIDSIDLPPASAD